MKLEVEQYDAEQLHRAELLSTLHIDARRQTTELTAHTVLFFKGERVVKKSPLEIFRAVKKSVMHPHPDADVQFLQI
jgi:hypothetical protein